MLPQSTMPLTFTADEQAAVAAKAEALQ